MYVCICVCVCVCVYIYIYIYQIRDSHHGDFERYTRLWKQLKFADVLEVRTVSIFWVDDYAKQPSSWVLNLKAIRVVGSSDTSMN
jgi:hypothetical protein